MTSLLLFFYLFFFKFASALGGGEGKQGLAIGQLGWVREWQFAPESAIVRHVDATGYGVLTVVQVGELELPFGFLRSDSSVRVLWRRRLDSYLCHTNVRGQVRLDTNNSVDRCSVFCQIPLVASGLSVEDVVGLSFALLCIFRSTEDAITPRAFLDVS